ncbi:MAG: tRNA-binding protein [Candidatus Marinimicrobia bacterium]|jgi:tRNA-binding protein|nr:tRNA-binding protein [Candidatus Neomarinimicrobiota bacterium]MBT3675164.1 tRNA-binding protein [Candidatus Neomarinimicrobiota bacterium]MBT3763874.1 tRNA-binding protein [Candidatus Neomarinimicrobiota bacterium]MBT4068003.1 tRNA-binding protein [Candidatus Neomarinimicrobiota bacterium]MBT4271236.1 tRNA-binding protein [Candidatus Neomarinimicrobiota bacterium]
MLDINNFGKLEFRIGTIEKAEDSPQAIKAAYKLRINFGSFGKKWSSAQITENYTLEELCGRRILAVMNLGPKKIGPIVSEVLVIGAEDEMGNIVLLEPDNDIQNGAQAK